MICTIFTIPSSISVTDRVEKSAGRDMPIVHKSGLKPFEISDIETETNRLLTVEHRSFLSGMNGFYLTAPDYVQLTTKLHGRGYHNF